MLKKTFCQRIFMVKFKKVVHGRHEGKVVLKDKIIDGIIFLAVSELPHVSFYTSAPFSKIKGNENIKVSLNKGNVTVQVDVKIYYMQNVSEIAFKVQETIRHCIESMTEYRVMSVNVVVKGVTFVDKPETKFADTEHENNAKESDVENVEKE